MRHDFSLRAGSAKRIPWSSLASRRLYALALGLSSAALPARALAGPADLDEPLLHPRRELDPRLDIPEPSRAPHVTSPRRAPVWFAIDASMLRPDPGVSSFGAMLLVGLPLDRLAGRGVRAPALAAGPARGDAGAPEIDAASPAATSPPPPPAPARSPPAPELKPPPRPKVDVVPQPPAPKVPPAPASALPPPLRIPVVVTSEAARAAVDAALNRAHLADPDARLDALASRARSSAALPELRLRALRSVDQGQTLSPTEYDPVRTTATGGSSVWMEARATWRLDRLLFADEEIALERMRHRRAEAQAKLVSRVLKLLFEWQRALALADNPAGSPEEQLVARLKAIEAEAELDLMTDRWFSRWRSRQGGP